jgi:hypothetical protein
MQFHYPRSQKKVERHHHPVIIVKVIRVVSVPASNDHVFIIQYDQRWEGRKKERKKESKEGCHQIQNFLLIALAKSFSDGPPKMNWSV